MNKIVNQEEREVNLVEVARKVVSKLGPRRLAAALILSSMVAFTGCGKNDEVTQQNVTVENNDDEQYRNRPLGGSIVDNHNGELYISKASDVESVVNADSIEDTNTEDTNKNQSSSNSQNTNTNSNVSTTTTSQSASTSTVPNETIVGNTTQEEVPAPNLRPGETVIYSNDGSGSYLVIPSQEFINPPQENTQQTSTDNSVSNPEQPSYEQVVEEVQKPNEEETKSYVVRKLNYPDDTYFYTFTLEDGEYFVRLTDVEFANEMSNINSNVLALATGDSELSYALAEGWVKVGLYNVGEYGYLDSVYNIEKVCDERVADALEDKEEADKEVAQGLGLGL